VGGFAFIAAGESAVLPSFLVPSIAGVIIIRRAFFEGRLAERAAAGSAAAPGDQ